MTIRRSPTRFLTPPPSGGAWFSLDDDDLRLACAALRDAESGALLLDAFHAGPSRARALPLPFYGDDVLLIDLEGAVADGVGAATFVLCPDRVVVMDGSSPPIHALSHDLGVRRFEDAEVGAAFLKFFGGCVWGEAGPFVISDTPREAAGWIRARPARLPVAGPARPLDRRGAFEATVIYDARLFRSVFQLSSSGTVEMIEDEIITGRLTPRLTFRPPFRILPCRAAGGVVTDPYPPLTRDLLVGWSLDRARLPVGFGRSVQPARDAPGGPIRLEGEGHLLTIAPTGSGKGVSAIIPTLLTSDATILCIDPKGENYAVTARRRRQSGHRVVLLDPLGVTGDTPDSLNPLDAITPFARDDVDEVAAVASALYADYSEPRDAFWRNRAQDLFVGVCCHVLAHEPIPRRTLGQVRALISAGASDPDGLRRILADSCHPEARLTAAGLGGMSETSAGVFSFALDGISFLRGEEVGAATGASSFSLAEVTEGEPISVFLVLPPDKLESHRRLLRLWITALISAVTRRRRRPERPTLFLLDEAAQLGTLPHLRQAMTLLRGYGLQVWSFWQGRDQLEALYPNDWRTMVANCRVIQAFGAQSLPAAQAVSDLIGFGDPDAVLDLGKDEMVLQLAGARPRTARKPNYLTDAMFVGLADANPYHTASGPVARPPKPLVRQPGFAGGRARGASVGGRSLGVAAHADLAARLGRRARGL